MDKRQLLQVLADGKFHSGQELANLWGVSRTAVWNYVKTLIKQGYDVHSVRGRGYRILGGVELLDATLIKQPMGDHLVAPIVVLESTVSTNDYYKDKKSSDVVSGSVVFAEYQTTGRGRHGRKWVAPFGMNLSFSCFWHFNRPIQQLSGLSLVIGLAIVRALQAYGISSVQLKWPNDVLYKGKKLAGVLIESQTIARNMTSVVMGIGLNVNMSKAKAVQIDQPWTDINTIMGHAGERNVLAGLLLKELFMILPEFEQLGFAAYRKEWQKADALFNHEVEVEVNQQRSYGVESGVDEQGNLCVKMGASINTYHSGEIKLRLV